MMLKCQECGGSFEAVRRDARYCGPRCRRAAHRRRAGDLDPQPGPTGGLRRVVDTWLVSAAGVPEPLAESARAIASVLDARPASPAMWNAWLGLLDKLREYDAAAPDFDAWLAELDR
jgi:hypothetical protein